MTNKKEKNKNPREKREEEIEEGKFGDISPVKVRKGKVSNDDEALDGEEEFKHKPRKHKHRDVWGEDEDLGDEYGRRNRPEEDQKERKKGNLNINVNESSEIDDTYSGIKRKNKNNAFQLDPKKAS